MESDRSPDALEIAAALVWGASTQVEPEVDDALLIRFAAGLVSAEEHEVVVDALTRSDPMRTHLVGLRRDLARQADANVIGDLLRRAIGGYQALAVKVADLADPFTLSALRAAGRRLAQDLTGPQWATVRSGVSESVEPWTMKVRPKGLEATVVAELSGGGDLTLTVSLDEELPHLDLCLRDPVFGFIVLAQAEAEAGAFRFKVPHFAELAGIDRIEPAIFSLVSGDTEEAAGSGSLLADVPSGDPAWVRVLSKPTVSSGVLRMAVALPAGVRQRMSNCRLELQLLVGSLVVPLAASPISGLDSDEVQFSAEIGQVPDGAIGAGSVFRLQFK